MYDNNSRLVIWPRYHNHNVDLMLKYRFWFGSDPNKFIYWETRFANTIDNISNVSPWVFTYLIVMINVSGFQLRSLAIAQTGKIIRVLKTTIFIVWITLYKHEWAAWKTWGKKGYSYQKGRILKELRGSESLCFSGLYMQ